MTRLARKTVYMYTCAHVSLSLLLSLTSSYPPKESSLKNSRRGPFGLSASLYLGLLRFFFLTPVGPIKKLDFIVRTVGRTGGRAYLVFVEYLLEI